MGPYAICVSNLYEATIILLRRLPFSLPHNNPSLLTVAEAGIRLQLNKSLQVQFDNVPMKNTQHFLLSATRQTMLHCATTVNHGRA